MARPPPAAPAARRSAATRDPHAATQVASSALSPHRLQSAQTAQTRYESRYSHAKYRIPHQVKYTTVGEFSTGLVLPKDYSTASNLQLACAVWMLFGTSRMLWGPLEARPSCFWYLEACNGTLRILNQQPITQFRTTC